MEQDELFQLIKALSKNEKKFFTQYVNLYEKGASPTYLKLFEYLNNEENYSEEKVFRKFRDPAFKKNYSVTRHYLKNLIIKTLRHSEITSREEADLGVFILDIKRLLSKGLIPMAKKMIEKIKADALSDEKFHDALQCISMQRSLISMGYYRYEPEVTLDALDDEEERVLDKMKQLRQVMNATIHIYSLMHYELSALPDEVVKQIHQLGTRKYLQDFDSLTSAKAKHTFLHFWTLYYDSQGDYRKSMEFSQKKLDFVKGDNLPPSASVNWLILAHSHCLTNEMLTGDCSLFEEQLYFLEKLELKSSFHDAERFLALAQFSMLYYIKYFDEKKLAYYLNYTREGLTRLAPFIRRFAAYTLRTIMAYAYLKLKKLDECWSEVNDLMSLTNGETRRDFAGHVRLINLMLRYEMKEYNYVSYLLKSTYRFFVNYLYTKPAHKFMIGYLKEAMKAPNQRALTELNKNYLQILRTLRFDPSETEMSLVMMAENYLSNTHSSLP